MTEHQSNEWVISLDGDALPKVFEFKFVGLDDAIDVTPLWETGANRTIELPILQPGDVIVYEPNGISGSPNEPTVISFVRTDHLPQDGWYTLQGIKLQQTPVQPGVYIYNGKKQVVK
jgi:hypothetical protein